MVMDHMSRRMDSFPSVSLRHHAGGLPVEVTLIGQLGPGGGDRLIASVEALQARHPRHVDALDEPSARIGAMDLERGDASALYSFVVGPQGHPFHRHAGHRVFTAVTGSGGASLRFSTATRDQIDEDPEHFFRALECVLVPPDAMVTVRFGGDTWHQFAPLGQGNRNPVLMALSCHTNELGGVLSPEVRSEIEAGNADIPTLTELLPDVVGDRLAAALEQGRVPVTALSFNTPGSSILGRACLRLRSTLGTLRGRLRRWRMPMGWLTRIEFRHPVIARREPPADALLSDVLAEGRVHEDWFELSLPAGAMPATDAAEGMSRVLDGFLHNQAGIVTGLMAFRNTLVRPFGLRTSPLGCPASSLCTDAADATRFAGRFPVLAARTSANGQCVDVLLGADDRHLVFRSCVRVERQDDGRVRVCLGTRVKPLNAFGHAYMALIERVHRHCIAPTMLRSAVEHAIRVAGTDVPTGEDTAWTRAREKAWARGAG